MRSWAARIVAYCPASRDPNSSGSSAPSATVAPAASSVGQRHRGQVGVDAERDVGDRAHLEGDAGGDDPVEQGGVLGRPDAVPEPVGVQVVEAQGGCGRVRAARRRAGTSSSPARSAIAKAGANSAVVPRRSSLESPKPTTPRPAYCAASRARVRASSGCRVRLAAITTAMPRPVSRDGLGDGVEHQVGERGDAAEPGGVAARVHLDLQPAARRRGRRPRRPRAPAGVRRPRCAAPTGRRRRAAGTGTSPSRRPPSSSGGQS